MKVVLSAIAIFPLLMILLSACQQKSPQNQNARIPQPSLILKSAAFSAGNDIPQKYSCDGEDISPPLAWSNTPEGTQSFALIFDDPDAPNGTWDHWLIYNLPGSLSSLSENASLPAKAGLGQNSWKKREYGGPCPPSGTHRYFFKLYALDTMLNFDSPPDKQTLLKAMEGHIWGEAELMGTFTR